MTAAYIGLGSNLNEPRAQVVEAFDELAALPQTRMVARSPLYRSAPVDAPGQPDFVNAVAAVQTELSAAQLLDALQGIEARHARQRSTRNAPRTLDLDLLLYDEMSLSSPTLTLPHPRMHLRAFVLRPLLDLDPRAEIPGRGAARELLRVCATQAIERLDD
ncbi:MAG TPA: 2-amino-4-hydroxy-6-hydroxymethyldihydropteridine diphosphokinase [Burkholderiales bacterium]|nr:2-amino-4-hydroxy-6-hydroxymethyldihydropteridine diphosphokinase [Burkholderiales bacterium]